MKIYKRLISSIVIVISVVLYFFSAYPTESVNMQSPQYQIQGGNVNVTSGSSHSGSYQLTDTVGQLAAGEFASQGYLVQAGFQHLYSIIPFRFTIADVTIDLGRLTPNRFSTADTQLTVSFGGLGQYQVTAIEQGKLRTLNNLSFIPDASCDGGNQTCSERLARMWTSVNAYGFGYSLTGQDIPADFINNNFFRRFPDQQEEETPQIVMTSNNVGRGRQATITFKVNIPPQQPAGTYQTVISFVATPSF